MTAYAKLLRGKMKVLQEQHIDARALIVASRKGNLVLAHPGCNQRRGIMPLSPIDAARARLITLAVRLARKRRGIASY